MPESDALYDRVGAGYRATRIPDPRIARQIAVALGDSRSVANIGAGRLIRAPDDGGRSGAECGDDLRQLDEADLGYRLLIADL